MTDHRHGRLSARETIEKDARAVPRYRISAAASVNTYFREIA